MASINISSFAGAGAQFFDNNGTPLVGGLLYVYTAGTTTPATTYTGPSGTVNNTNPIVLDAGGRTPYEIWVTGGALYKFVLKNSTGVTIGTYDSIPAIDDPTAFNNFITVTGTNTLIGTSTPANTAYASGMTLSFVVVNTNTGAVTIDVDGLGAKEITLGPNPLTGGDLVAGRIAWVEYDGTRFQVTVGYVADASVTSAKMANGGAEFGMHNRIINGDFKTWQRGSPTFGTVGTVYAADRWYVSTQNATSIVTTDDASVTFPTSGFTSALTAFGTASNTVITIGQRIESLNCSGMTASTQFTVRVWLYSQNARTPTWSIDSANATDNFSAVTNVASGTFASLSAGVGAYRTFTFTTNANCTKGIQLSIGFGTVNSSTIVGITGVQLEKGSFATPFEFRPYSVELSLCQRYYQKTGTGSGGCDTTTSINAGFLFTVPMRAAPTVTLLNTAPQIRASNAVATGSSSAISASYVTAQGVVAVINGFTGLTANAGLSVITAALIGCSSEI